MIPYLVRQFGSDGFGFWSLLLILLATLTTLDGGLGASLVRFFGLLGARGERDDVTRLLLAATLVFVVLGGIVLLLSLVGAPWVVARLDMDESLRTEAVRALRWLGPLVVLALSGNAVVALLQAHGRFGALVFTSMASSIGYVVGVVAFTRIGLDALIIGLAMRYIIIIVVGLAAARSHLRIRRPLLPSSSTRREVIAYSSRMQASALTTFFNSEIDALVISALLPVRYVGMYAAGAQAASALRSLPLFAFPPILMAMTKAYSLDGQDGAVREFVNAQRRWLPAVLAYGAVATCSVGFGVYMWLGDEYRTAGVIAAILMAGFTVHVALTGVRTCFVRSIGRPGLETRYSLLSMIVNLMLTVPFALLFDAVGVVAATSLALSGASVYFVRLCARVAPLPRTGIRIRWVAAIGIACAATLAGEVAVIQLSARGTLALALAGIPPALALGFLILLRRTSVAPEPRPASSTA